MTKPVTQTVLSAEMAEAKKKIIGHSDQGATFLMLGAVAGFAGLVLTTLCIVGLYRGWGFETNILLGHGAVATVVLGMFGVKRFRDERKLLCETLDKSLLSADKPNLPIVGKKHRRGDCITDSCPVFPKP